MATDTMLAIAVTDIRPSCKDEPDLIERIKKAMRKAQDFWMSTDDDLRFRGAVGAAMLESTPEERERIERSVRVLRSFSALASGVPVDFAAALEEAGEDAIPLMKLWREAANPA